MNVIKKAILEFIKSEMTSENLWIRFDDILKALNYDKELVTIELIRCGFFGSLDIKIDGKADISDNTMATVNNMTEETFYKGIINDDVIEMYHCLMFCDIEQREKLANIHFDKLRNEAVEGMKELMEIYAKNENYERAAFYRDKINEALNKK